MRIRIDKEKSRKGGKSREGRIHRSNTAREKKLNLNRIMELEKQEEAEKLWSVTFVAKEPVERKGTFKTIGDHDTALAKLKTELGNAFEEFVVTNFEEVIEAQEQKEQRILN